VPAPDRFHARHDAAARSYLYQLATRRTALHKRYVWWVRRSLDLDAMRAGAAALLGRHDFRAFCERPHEQTSTLVVVDAVEVVPAGSLVLLRFVASHFLWKMVRRLVGVLVEVGRGQMTDAQAASLFEADPRTVAPLTAPASGLFLERVYYKNDPRDIPLRGAVRIASST